MRNKNLIGSKLERIESKLKVLNFHLRDNNKGEAYSTIKFITELMSEIQTLLNTETQD